MNIDRKNNLGSHCRRHAATALMCLAALALAGCSAGDDATLDDYRAQNAAGPETVDFGAYLQRATTRSGAQGTLTLDGASGTQSLKTQGFGVLAYYTGVEPYGPLSTPNYMYNQQVTNSSGTAWTYSPVMYWPNGEGEATSQRGLNDHLVSFFAYAPWVSVTAKNGLVADDGSTGYSSATGITALTRSTKGGDPLVRYDVTFDPSKRVDLCWAQPKLDQTKPGQTDAKVDFQFRHALASLNVQIDSDIDQEQNGGAQEMAYTRVWVRSIRVEGISNKGWLNLNNDTAQPAWLSTDGYSSLSISGITVTDGRRDGREAILADANETVTGLNPKLIQSEPYTITNGAISAPEVTGVTTTTVNAFGNDTDGSHRSLPVFVIPYAVPLRVTVVYDVETYDAQLASNHLSDGRTPGSTIENNITASVIQGGEAVTLDAGKSYVLKLHLGLRSVEAEATVSNQWEEGYTEDLDQQEDFEDDTATTLGVSVINNYNTGNTVSGDITL